MPVDDLWMKKGPNGKKVPSQRHGRGKRYRVRFTDATGQPSTRLFKGKREADDWDAQVRAGVVDAAKVDQAERRSTFAAYTERWRLAREVGMAIETKRRVESNLRLHLVPTFGPLPMSGITTTRVLEWLTAMVKDGLPKTSIRLYYDLLRTVMRSAVTDKVMTANPTDGIRLDHILRGLSRAPKWVPTAEQVVTLFEVVPARYKAAMWLGAGQGVRIGEALGMENTTRCTDFLRRELHVVQQLRHSPEHGGFYLSEPKSGSSGTVDLDPEVSTVLAEHIRLFPPVEVDLTDITSGDPVKRRASLLFTTERGKPLTDKRWSELWTVWRKAAGWPEGAGFHELRHFFATTLITAGVEPQAVQKALRHANLKITLETYVGFWPKVDRPRGLVSGALRAAAEKNDEAATGT